MDDDEPPLGTTSSLGKSELRFEDVVENSVSSPRLEGLDSRWAVRQLAKRAGEIDQARLELINNAIEIWRSCEDIDLPLWPSVIGRLALEWCERPLDVLSDWLAFDPGAEIESGANFVAAGSALFERTHASFEEIAALSNMIELLNGRPVRWNAQKLLRAFSEIDLEIVAEVERDPSPLTGPRPNGP